MPIGNMFNDDETIKKESKVKFTDMRFLKRIESGRELVRIISSAHQREVKSEVKKLERNLQRKLK